MAVRVKHNLKLILQAEKKEKLEGEKLKTHETRDKGYKKVMKAKREEIKSTGITRDLSEKTSPHVRR